MRVVFVTDLHMHKFTEFAKLDADKVSDRFEAQLNTLQAVFDTARKEKATLIIGGDVFHNRGAVGTRVFNLTFEVFLRNPDVPVIIVRGNHDSVTNSLYTVSSIEPLGALDNVEIISEPTTKVIEDTKFLFMPYGDETEIMKEYINAYEPGAENNVLVGHLGLEGALQGKGNHRLAGAFGIRDLRPDVFDYIMLGHYHKRQTVGDNPNHFYGGNFMQVNFGDEGQLKGLHIVDTHEKLGAHFVALPNKMFYTVNGDELPEDLDTIMDENYVRFIGTKDQVRAIENMSTSTNMDLSSVRVEMIRDYKQEARLGIDTGMSEIEITKKYAEDKYPNALEEALECLTAVL